MTKIWGDFEKPVHLLSCPGGLEEPEYLDRSPCWSSEGMQNCTELRIIPGSGSSSVEYTPGNTSWINSRHHGAIYSPSANMFTMSNIYVTEWAVPHSSVLKSITAKIIIITAREDYILYVMAWPEGTYEWSGVHQLYCVITSWLSAPSRGLSAWLLFRHLADAWFVSKDNTEGDHCKALNRAHTFD